MEKIESNHLLYLLYPYKDYNNLKFAIVESKKLREYFHYIHNKFRNNDYYVNDYIFLIRFVRCYNPVLDALINLRKGGSIVACHNFVVENVGSLLWTLIRYIGRLDSYLEERLDLYSMFFFVKNINYLLFIF